jgi:hypothetical protein
MATTMQDVIREFVALNERYVAGALPAAALERWGDLVEVVDGELARCDAARDGLDCRRLYTRAPLRLPVRFSAASAIGMGETLDLSCAGCAVEARSPLPPGAEIQLSVRLPWGLGTLRPFGQVRWTAPTTTQGVWQAGVSFEPLARWEREVLASCVLGAVAPRFVEVA